MIHGHIPDCFYRNIYSFDIVTSYILCIHDGAQKEQELLTDVYSTLVESISVMLPYGGGSDHDWLLL